MLTAVKYVLLLCLLSAVVAAQVPPPEKKQNAPLPDAPSASASQSSASVASQSPAKATPNEAAPYTPLTKQQKAERWVHYTYSPYTFVSVLFNASWAQAMGDWPTYGGGMEGFGKRFGATLANTESSGFFKIFLLPTLLHQDPRYFRSSKRGFKARAWHAATRVVVTRNDNGSNGFNTSEVLGSAFNAGVSNAYYPRRDRGFPETMYRFSGTLLSDAGSNVLREFWPDIRRALRKHEPEKMKKIEDKIPQSIQKAAGPSEDE